jgi:hypothetical protein
MSILKQTIEKRCGWSRDYGDSDPPRAMARWSPLQESFGFLNLRSKRAHLRTKPKRGKNIRESG